MRVMICTKNGAGHIGPMLPFARAFLRNNDDVLVVAPRAAAPAIAGAGLDHHPIPDPPGGERDAIFDRARGLSADDANVLVVGQVFARIDTRASYRHVLRAIERWEPDLVALDASDFGAALAVEAARIPAACIGITQAAFMAALRDVVAEGLDEVRAEIGLDPDPELERLEQIPYFTLFPHALEDPDAPGPAGIMRFREDGHEPARPLPDWWAGNRDPLVYVTFGSVAPTMGFFPGLYRGVLDALATLPIRVLATVGRDRDPRELGAVGPNVQVARWIPQADVMPYAAAMVCHGGSGTVRGGMAAGVPTAVVPLFADQPHNARRVAELGAGIALEPDGAGVADAVQRLLSEPSYRRTAAQVADEIRRLPTVDTAAAIAQEMAARA